MATPMTRPAVQMSALRAGGAPPKLGLRWPASIAIDLATRGKINDTTAAAVAWDALQKLEAKGPQAQYQGVVNPESVTRIMRKIRNGKISRIMYSSAILLHALAQLPKKLPEQKEASAVLARMEEHRQAAIKAYRKAIDEL